MKSEEYQYLDLVKDILENGSHKSDRTGTGTLSIFGPQMTFSLRDNTIPLLTTKRVFFRGVVEELLWFISGSTDNNVLKSKGVNIWNDNASPEYLESIGLGHRKEGDLGPIYGFQWRHFGAEYVDKDTDYTDKGIDQLRDIIERIKRNPSDRRLILTAWNPVDLPKMALPPCHYSCQFSVENGELSCKLNQRSADMGLGVPFNIASYSLFTIMIAHITGLKPGRLIHSLGDAHIYLNHVDGLREQIMRTPADFPRINFKRQVKDIGDFKFEDIELIGYDPQASIPLKMSV